VKFAQLPHPLKMANVVAQPRALFDMSASEPPPSAYVLKYRVFDYFVCAGLLVPIVAFTLACVVLSDDPFLRQICLLISVISAHGAFLLLRSGLRYRRQNAWYVAFAPTHISLNFFDYSKGGAPAPGAAAVLTIQRDQVVWIRRTYKRGWGDDSDQFDVDMSVEHHIWQAAKRARAEFQPHFDPADFERRVGSVQFFDADILRISLDVSKWPADLVQHWQLCDYPVRNDYEIRAGTLINGNTPHPPQKTV
jgi:hypothetical protein